MKELVVFGAGGHGKVIADTAYCMGWSSILFYDDVYPSIKRIGEWDIIGTYSDLLKNSSHINIVIGIGNNLIRVQKAQELSNLGFNLCSIIHPKATISRSAQIASGTVIFAGAVINSDVTIDEHCIINTNSTVEHDCYLQTGVHISPGANLGGNVKIGQLSWIGIGSSIKHGINIGSNVTIGAGAAVIKDLPDNCTAVGIPATILKE
jgi:sugar O-acyltransferase (sialic acid O-acetyltransferase NeuD family)